MATPCDKAKDVTFVLHELTAEKLTLPFDEFEPRRLYVCDRRATTLATQEKRQPLGNASHRAPVLPSYNLEHTPCGAKTRTNGVRPSPISELAHMALGTSEIDDKGCRWLCLGPSRLKSTAQSRYAVVRMIW